MFPKFVANILFAFVWGSFFYTQGQPLISLFKAFFVIHVFLGKVNVYSFVSRCNCFELLIATFRLQYSAGWDKRINVHFAYLTPRWTINTSLMTFVFLFIALWSWINLCKYVCYLKVHDSFTYPLNYSLKSENNYRKIRRDCFSWQWVECVSSSSSKSEDSGKN